MKNVCMPNPLLSCQLSGACRRVLLCAFIIAALVLIDQISKHWMIKHLIPYQSQVIAPFFNLTLAFNQGAAFSFLHDQSGWQRWFFTGFAVIFIALFGYLICRSKRQHTVVYAALSLVTAGAIGNVIDRIRYGYVIDFLDFHIKTWHWPVFNIADSAISIGIAIYIIWTIFHKEQKSHKIL